jgi:6-carboxyhexanoate--CoA ligase
LDKGYTERTLDALALATKNALCGVVAEICISDDPDYTVGYIASPRLGYIRISPIKDKNLPLGGRIYFVERESLEKIIHCLRKKPILIKEAQV